MKLTERLSDTQRQKNTDLQDLLATSTWTPSLPLVARLHSLVIDQVDLRKFVESDVEVLRQRLRQSVGSVVQADSESGGLSPEQKAVLVERILDETVGLGPLEPLLKDPQISDILVNACDQVYVEKQGKLELTAVKFNDNIHLFNIISRIVSRVGRRVDEASPMVDARLPDGSRVNAVVSPIGADGPLLCIRRFGRKLLDPKALIERGVATPQMMQYLAAAVQAKCNLLVSGGTGAGKTTLLNVLSGFIPNYERVITIEDSVELSLQGHHVVRMESRPSNIEGKGEVTIRACVRNALRMRPDRVVIGEVRGAEVLDMLQAMNTGHEGSMATVHANTPSEAIDRLMMMLALSGVGLSNESMAQFIARSVRVVVQVARFADGARRITGIAEIGDYNQSRVDVHTVFSYSNTEKKFVYHGNTHLRERFIEHGVQSKWEGV